MQFLFLMKKIGVIYGPPCSFCASLLTFVSTKNKNSLIITFPCAISQGKDVYFTNEARSHFVFFELMLWMCNIAFERVSTTKIALVFLSHSYLVSKCLIVWNVRFIGFAEKESHVKFKTFLGLDKKKKLPKEIGKYRIIDSQETLWVYHYICPKIIYFSSSVYSFIINCIRTILYLIMIF